MTLAQKIAVFKKEVGNRQLTAEQQKVYDLFSGKNTKKSKFVVTDRQGCKVSFIVYADKSDCGVQHILNGHYKESKGYVTALEILNLCDVIRDGDSYKSGAYTVYRLTNTRGGVTLRTVLRLSGNGLLKSFYSDRGKENGSWSACTSAKAGSHRKKIGQGATSKSRCKNTK